MLALMLQHLNVLNDDLIICSQYFYIVHVLCCCSIECWNISVSPCMFLLMLQHLICSESSQNLSIFLCTCSLLMSQYTMIGTCLCDLIGV